MDKNPHPLARCVKIVGSQAAVGAIVGVIQQTVSAVITNNRPVPAEWVLPLETATRIAGQLVSRHQLRPDLYPMDITPITDTPRKARKKAA